MYRNTTLMYPSEATNTLHGLRTQRWNELIEHVSVLDETTEDALAFQLMMIRLCGCLKCQPGSYKLLLGCQTCAARTVANYKGSDASLMRRFKRAQKEVRTFLAGHQETADS